MSDRCSGVGCLPFLLASCSPARYSFTQPTCRCYCWIGNSFRDVFYAPLVAAGGARYGRGEVRDGGDAGLGGGPGPGRPALQPPGTRLGLARAGPAPPHTWVGPLSPLLEYVVFFTLLALESELCSTFALFTRQRCDVVCD